MELKTIDGWCKSDCGSWDEYCKPGEVVDEGVADYFLNILPPRTMKMGYFQVGEPHSTAVNPKTKRYPETYATFLKVGKECGSIEDTALQEKTWMLSSTKI